MSAKSDFELTVGFAFFMARLVLMVAGGIFLVRLAVGLIYP